MVVLLAHPWRLRGPRTVVQLALVFAAVLGGCAALSGPMGSAEGTIQGEWSSSPVQEEPQVRPVQAQMRRETGSHALAGLESAAAALAAGRSQEALATLARLSPSVVGSEAWFVHGAIEGRAARLLALPQRAVEALRPRWNHRDLKKHVPPEAIGVELARSQLAWAAQSSLDVSTADQLRSNSVALLAALLRLKTLRNEAEIKVMHARALASVQGRSRKQTLLAGKRAVTALDKVLREFPNHPERGQLELVRARALARAGRATQAAVELRNLAIRYTGSPEGDEAFRELQALAAANRRIHAPPFSQAENLLRAQWARSLRNVETSRAILDELIGNPKLAPGLRAAAIQSRSYTAYKQRDFATCAADLRPFVEAGNGALRDELLRCLERGHQYDEAIDIWMGVAAKQKRKKAKAPALWAALQIAVHGGAYRRARELLTEWERVGGRGHVLERLWLEAWLLHRLGQRDQAIAAFAEVERRSRGDAERARYFRGKLLVASNDPEQRDEGSAILRRVIDADPLGYYGLQARQRLLDAGLKPPPVVNLQPMADEATPPDALQVRAQFDALTEQFGEHWPSLVRAHQFHEVGYLEEARRELRVTVEAYANGRGMKRGYEPRSESLEAGLVWRSRWRRPNVLPTRDARKGLRDDKAAETLRAGLRSLSHALAEPHDYARLSPVQAGAYKARWQPRAYRTQIEREAARRKVDPSHLWALMYTESRFRRFVVSPVGARGALQIMPWTARQLLDRLDEPSGDFNVDRLFDIDENARLATYYFSELLVKFHGQAPMAYASYNGGPDNVQRWVVAKANGPTRLDLDTFIEEIPFRESYRYTKRVMETAAVYDLLYRKQLPRWTNAVDAQVEENIDF